MKFIILAGGSGTRLWPLSRELTPKSLLPLIGKKSLLENTFNLALSFTSSKNILTVTNIRQGQDTKFQLEKIVKNPSVIYEPLGKNTSAAILSALTFLQSQKDELVVILPCDFAIEDEAAFSEIMEKSKINAKNGYISAVGVKPAYPETGFGYIKIGEKIKSGFKVEKFIEKPSKSLVEQFITDDSYFWNCGIYIGKISAFLSAFQTFLPDMFTKFNKSMFDENNKIKFEFYENIPNISIDYSIIEKIENLAFIKLNSKWSDFGSWKALYDFSKKDKNNNVLHGNVICDKVKNSFVYSSKELVCVASKNDIIAVETEDAVLVCDKSRSADINKVVLQLKTNYSELTKTHKTVFRPWGFYTCLNSGDGWLTKIITVSPGHKLSLQSHNHRSEHWVVLEGVANVVLNGEVHTLNKAQSIDIPLKAKHSLQNHSDKVLKILELQKGSYISEDDIIRYEDMYGRVN